MPQPARTNADHYGGLTDLIDRDLESRDNELDSAGVGPVSAIWETKAKTKTAIP